MKEIIKNYLSGPRLYTEGISLYERFANNMALKRAFRLQPESRILRLTLYEELRKLAGLSEEEYNNLPRYSQSIITAEVSDSNKRVVSDSEKERIRFRDRFPFLRSNDCPDVLKLLVNDMFASYDAYRKAHNDLASMPADAPLEQTGKLAATAVEEMLNDRTIWDELQYYQEHKQLLGVHSDVKDYLKWKEYREMSDFVLVQKRKNAASNVSKYKVKIEGDDTEENRKKHEASLREWIAIREICDQEIERRKGGC